MSEGADVAAALAGDLARALVDHPDDVVATVAERSRGPAVELRVNESDMGQVIGRGGRVARALRTLVTASAREHGDRVVLDIVD